MNKPLAISISSVRRCNSFPFFLFQNMTLNYDTSGVGQNGVAATHMLPAATLTQYSRHYGQLPGYQVPGTPWVAPYLVHPSPPHMQQVDVSFYILFVHFVFIVSRALIEN